MLLQVMSILAEAGSLSVLFLLGKRKRWAWLLGVASQIPWAVLGYLTGAMGLYIGAFLFALVYLRGWICWRSEIPCYHYVEDTKIEGYDIFSPSAIALVERAHTNE